MDSEKICYKCMRKKTEIVCEHCGFDNLEYQIPNNHLPPMTTLNGRYLIGAALGAGRLGITYVAYDTHLQVVVAIKELFLYQISQREQSKTIYVMPKDCDCFENHKKYFLNEARILAMFNENDDEGVVIVKDRFEENNTVYIVMEYLEGSTLKRKVERKKMTFKEVEELMAPICHSLTKIHQFGVVHLDVNPDNIIILESGRAKLLDFGGLKTNCTNLDSEIASFKRGYVPPEQYMENGKLGQWSDVYATAAMIYFCLSGRKPVDAMERMAGVELEAFSKLGVQISKRVENVLMTALELEPAKRYQTMEEFWEAFYSHKGGRAKGVVLSATLAAMLGIGGYWGYTTFMSLKQSEDSLMVQEESGPEIMEEITLEIEPEEDVIVYHEGDLVSSISGNYNVASALDGKTSMAIGRDKEFYSEPTVVVFQSEWLTDKDTAFMFEFIPTGKESRYKIRPCDQIEGENQYLEYNPETNELVMRDESDNPNQLFRIVYVCSNTYLLQVYNEAVVGFDLEADGSATGKAVLARPYDAVEDSRLETWMLTLPHVD